MAFAPCGWPHREKRHAWPEGRPDQPTGDGERVCRRIRRSRLLFSLTARQRVDDVSESSSAPLEREAPWALQLGPRAAQRDGPSSRLAIEGANRAEVIDPEHGRYLAHGLVLIHRQTFGMAPAHGLSWPTMLVPA